MKEVFPGVCEDAESINVSDAELSSTHRRYRTLRTAPRDENSTQSPAALEDEQDTASEKSAS